LKIFDKNFKEKEFYMNKITQQFRTYYIDQPHYKYLDLLGMLYVMALLTSTIAASKLIEIGPFLLSGTIIVYSVTYILSDIFTEVYGYKASRRIIWAGMILLILSTLIIYVVTLLPPAKVWTDEDAFQKIFGMAPIITFSVIASYFTGELVNSYTLAKLKILMNGNFLFVRTISSTMVGVAIDSIIMFVSIAYGWSLSINENVHFIISGWIICVAYETFMTPITYRIVGWLKRAEGVDIYDKDTDFNPLHI